MLRLVLVREASVEACMCTSVTEARASVAESNYQLDPKLANQAIFPRQAGAQSLPVTNLKGLVSRSSVSDIVALRWDVICFDLN